MATRNVTQSGANAASGSTIYTLAELINDLVALANELRTDLRTQILAGDPGFAINSNFDVANASAFTYMIDGVPYNLAASQNFDTGTSASLSQGKWGVILLSVDSSGSTNVTWDAGDYADEATALANIPATPSGECPVGIVTVQAHASNSFTAGTDALNGGSGGNAAQATNYYDGTPNPVAAAAVDDISFTATGAP